METIDLIYKEVLAVREDIKAVDDRVDALEVNFKLMKVRHGLLGIMAGALVAIGSRAGDFKTWLSALTKG